MSHPGVIMKNNGREIWADYNEVNLLETDERKQAKLEMWIAKNIGDIIMAKYPNRQWGVRVDINGGMIIISCDSLSLEKGYHLPIRGDNIAALQQHAVRACGEVLERYSVSRNRVFNPDHLETLKRDFKGEAVSVDSAPDPISKGLKKSGH